MKTISCPGCNRKMLITELKCPDCNIKIKGVFQSHRFGYLDKESLDFIETFILSRGNIKDIEKALGVSYPTVKTKLDKVITELERIKSLEEKNGQITTEK
ncbi:MAG: DUF2089 domain-containing protein [Spirochaetes bacterium]|nr:DUF2089 domain-containing protein [Spirochaetota bacterium]